MNSDSKKKPMAAIAPFGLRMQPDLKDRIEKSAEDNNRSMNAEIVARLEASFQPSANLPLSAERLVDLLTEQHRLIVDLQNISKSQSKQIDRLLQATDKDRD